MKTKKVVILGLVTAAVSLLVLALAAWANVPPPPVNQRVGIADTTFNNMAEPDCRACHNTNPPAGVPVNPTYLPTRHHNLVNQTIICPTAAPNVTCPTTGTYQCDSCHTQVWDPINMVWNFAPFRDCTACHKQSATGATVHHATALAVAQNCKSCHGALIDNPWAWEIANNKPKHYIPTYQPSMVTPRAGLGQTTGPLGAGQGGCAYCHRPGTDTSTGKNITVYTNAQTHHSTGLAIPPYTYPPGSSCLLCHDTNPGDTADIRTCQQCHGVGSLHNIQVNSPAPANPTTIVPGKEDPYYGHIGNNIDCNGCHLNTTASASAPYSGPVAPDVIGMSEYTLTQGTAVTITVDGSAFTNIVEGPTGPMELTSNVVLTAADGSTITLTPAVITQSSLDVVIPATLASGNYELRVVKGPKASNPTILTIQPVVLITSATCSNGVVTIKGSGFNGYMPATEPGTGAGTGVLLFNNGTSKPCSIVSWSDTQIVANAGTCGGTVEVHSVFGTASKIVEVIAPANKPPVAEAGPNKSVRVNTSVKFDGSASKDPDGLIVKYEWKFGDNTSGTGKIVYHKYTRRGTYTVTLKVTDNKGASGTDAATVKVY